MCGRFSTTRTRLPSWLATRSAIVRPKNPEPTTKRSKRAVIDCIGYPTARPQPARRLRRSAAEPQWLRGGSSRDRIWRAPAAAGVAFGRPPGDECRDWFTIRYRHTSHSSHASTIDHVGILLRCTGRTTEDHIAQIEETSVPNRRRRRLSTAMSAVAALAVASPFAYLTVSQLAADSTPAPEHHEFVRAAVMSDLPNELMSALTQGLSQFGINMPPVPSLAGGGATATPGLTSPGLTSPGLTSPGLTTPGATPGLTTPGLTTPGATPGLTTPGATPGLTTPGATPGLTTPGATPGLTDPSLTNPGLTDPSLTNPAGATPGLTSPTGTTPGLTSPAGVDPSLINPGA